MDKEIEKLNSAKSYEELKKIYLNTSREAFIKWVAKNPEGAILTRSFEEFNQCIEAANDDYTRAIMTIALGDSANNKIDYYNLIQDKFCKMKITEGWEIYDELNEQALLKFIGQQLPKMKEYKPIKERVEQCNSEDEKTNYIMSIQDNDMKISLLDEIKEPKNREKIISSFNRNVDKDIVELDREARTMIWEFVNDHYKGEIPQDKKERLMITLQRTNCQYHSFENSCQTGEANYQTNTIRIGDRTKIIPSLAIGYMLHEYAHMLSNNEFKHTGGGRLGKELEEGNADLFADLVGNYYNKKHQIGNGEPYETLSAYHKENAYARTLLYPLQAKGKDIDAMMEYMLGSKEKYFEQVLSKEVAQKLPRDQTGQINVAGIRIDSMYKCHKGEYKEQPDSIYIRRNEFIADLISRDRESKEGLWNTIKESSMIGLVKQVLAKSSITVSDIKEAETVEKQAKINQRGEFQNEK